MNENENNEVIQTEEDINRLMQVRIDKLKELQEAGKDPFEITKYDRTEQSMDIKNNYETTIPSTTALDKSSGHRKRHQLARNIRLLPSTCLYRLSR